MFSHPHPTSPGQARLKVSQGSWRFHLAEAAAGISSQVMPKPVVQAFLSEEDGPGASPVMDGLSEAGDADLL